MRAVIEKKKRVDVDVGGYRREILKLV